MTRERGGGRGGGESDKVIESVVGQRVSDIGRGGERDEWDRGKR